MITPQQAQEVLAYVAEQMAWHGSEEFAREFGKVVQSSKDSALIILFGEYAKQTERIAYLNEFMDMTDEGFTEDEHNALQNEAAQMDGDA